MTDQKTWKSPAGWPKYLIQNLTKTWNVPTFGTEKSEQSKTIRPKDWNNQQKIPQNRNQYLSKLNYLTRKRRAAWYNINQTIIPQDNQKVLCCYNKTADQTPGIPLQNKLYRCIYTIIQINRNNSSYRIKTLLNSI